MVFNKRFNDDAQANPLFQKEFARGGDPAKHAEERALLEGAPKRASGSHPAALSGSMNKPLGNVSRQAAGVSGASSTGGCKCGGNCGGNTAASMTAPGASSPMPNQGKLARPTVTGQAPTVAQLTSLVEEALAKNGIALTRAELFDIVHKAKTKAVPLPAYNDRRQR
jgi:hypothetical protein